MNKSEHMKIRKWSAAGIFVVTVLGSVFHFFYEWMNHSLLAAAFFPVNESVWEHLKLGLWGLMAFSVPEYLFIGKYTRNYFFAKAAGVWIISGTVVLIFYSYTALLHDNYLVLDISSFVAGVILCQLFSYKTFLKPHSKNLQTGGIILLVLTIAVMILATYFPPQLGIFRDNNNNTYGIPVLIQPELQCPTFGFHIQCP